MIVLYRLIGGLWQAIGKTSITPPAPPPPVTGYGTGPYGSGTYN